MTNIIVIDNFYDNPDAERDHALSLKFGIVGNYPGERTQPNVLDKVNHKLQHIITPHGGQITDWGIEYNASYQYTTAADRSWIHCDNYNTWAGVCYLTPNAPLTSGTGIFKHLPSGLSKAPTDKDLYDRLMADGNDMTKWHIQDMIGNVYNRLVLYRGSLYHTSLDYFGKNVHDGRLFQVFFFNTEY